MKPKKNNIQSSKKVSNPAPMNMMNMANAANSLFGLQEEYKLLEKPNIIPKNSQPKPEIKKEIPKVKQQNPKNFEEKKNSKQQDNFNDNISKEINKNNDKRMVIPLKG